MQPGIIYNGNIYILLQMPLPLLLRTPFDVHPVAQIKICTVFARESWFAPDMFSYIILPKPGGFRNHLIFTC